MHPLSTTLRNKLENTVKAARDVAEDAARAAIEQLGVQLNDKPDYLDDDQAELRVRLRAHARQVGDVRNPDGTQAINHLVVETAYEHWHRMLFARFLAENHLLMHPDGVAVSLAECDDLALDEDAVNGWELAGRYAARMLPQIFRPDAPVLELHFAPEYLKRLERLLADLAREVFTASDSLGWVYQFWQAKKKDEVNLSEVKIGAEELPAVTQLFTEPYMVQFLLHNSLGAWWVINHPNDRCPVELNFLRTLEDGTPAGGGYEGWPECLKEVKVLDPSCGSGHFLVAAFLMLVPMRMWEEGLSASDACSAVLTDNLHGLEIDQRCIEIAAFALALTAWKYPGAGNYRELPELNLACSGVAISAKRNEWIALAKDDQKFRLGMGQLYDSFIDAPVLGSLIRPDRLGTGSAFIAGYSELKPLLSEALGKEVADGNCEVQELGVAAQGLSLAAELLSQKYHLVVTNVPYLARGKQSESLKHFCKTYYPDSKTDLAAVFIERNLQFCAKHGQVALVTQQNCLYQDYYTKLRSKLLKHQSWKLLARLGPGAFGSITGEIVNVMLLIMQKTDPDEDGFFGCLNAYKFASISEKELFLLGGDLQKLNQFRQLTHPNKKIITEEVNVGSDYLLSCMHYTQGICTGDYSRFGRVFWELPELTDQWKRQQSTVKSNTFYGGMEHVILWENGSGALYEFICERLEEDRVGSWLRGGIAWGNKGIAVSSTGSISVSLYTGELFDDSTMVLIPKDETLLPAIWAFCSSPEYGASVRKIDKKLNVRSALIKVPFDPIFWEERGKIDYPDGFPEPYSDDPTQWIFHGYPVSVSAPLQVAVARLLGYRWPAEIDEYLELSGEARQLVDRCSVLKSLVDEDGIVCIPPVWGEKSASERLHNFLVSAYGDAWTSSIVPNLLSETDCSGKTLENWLRDKFFEQHFKLFHHRPFIWHIWDGVKDGFAALVNYHKLTRQNLETLIYTYLGDWIKRQEDEIKQGKDGATIRLAAAKKLKAELEKILEGEKPYDIFVRWKPLDQQPIGWDPDLNDGVRLNIRPFIKAGVLRKNPNINWNKDRGKDVESAPWYHEFDGDRINDHHLSLADKRAARGLKA